MDFFFFFCADFGKSSGQNNTKGHMGTGTNPFNSLKRTPKKRKEIGWAPRRTKGSPQLSNWWANKLASKNWNRKYSTLILRKSYGVLRITLRNDTNYYIMIGASVSVLNTLPITSFCCPCFNTFIRLTHHSYIRRNHNPIKPFNFLSMTKSISSNVNNRKPTQGYFLKCQN